MIPLLLLQQEIFLGEADSNASDAVDKACFESVAKPQTLLAKNPNYGVRIGIR